MDITLAEVNMCCPQFIVLPCGDIKTHCHIICQSRVDNEAILGNSYAKLYCLSDNFNNCPHRPKGET